VFVYYSENKIFGENARDEQDISEELVNTEDGITKSKIKRKSCKHDCSVLIRQKRCQRGTSHYCS
jgi:hypothetical protein